MSPPEIQRCEAIVDELLRRQVEALQERGTVRCEHLTLRTSYLPCPHPDCSGTQTTLRVARLAKPNYSLWSTEPQAVTQEVEVETWDRDFIGAASAKIWQWRRVR